ncbi:Tritrans,polycis-undecaprenyl-diphosphate synthase (GGDP specific) [uncultured archaeon]|nr:Tritrans,polycis-undecaprenyl-diphosphate synthase (GGDP specific) [uncultured archaeon]
MKKSLHVGIILDGNRRFAKRLMREPWQGHKYGAKKVEEVFSWCKDLNIKEITLYALSVENLNRPKKELNFLMNLFEEEFEKLENDSRLEDNKIRIKFIGKRELLNKKLQKTMGVLEKKTEKNNRYKINIAMAYGGRQEIIKAVKLMIKNKQDITEKNLEKNLSLNSSPDLIIRTGGEKRTSNFLPWQSVYSEWFFLKKMWPEFNKEDLKRVILEFYKRERRFGK